MIAGNGQEGLDAGIWFTRVSRLRDGLRAPEVSPGRHIRQAYHLHCLAPAIVRHLSPAPIAEANLEAMLSAGDYGLAIESFIRPAPSGPAASGIELLMRAVASLGETASLPIEPLAMLDNWAMGVLTLKATTH